MIFLVMASLAAGLGVGLFVWAVWAVVQRQFERDVELYRDKLRTLFVRSFSPRLLALLSYAGTLLVALAAGLASWSLLIGVVVGAAAYILPRQILVHLWLRRMRRFEIQLVESLPYLANNLRSGMALPQAVESLITNSEPPLSEEFGFTMREYSHGKTLSEAFEAMRHRIPSLNLKLILMAVDICREQGGNLSDLLEGMSDDLREIHGIDEKVQSLTAEGRLQAKLLAISPFVLGAMMYFAQPEMQESFYGSIAGKGLTVLAILLTVGGFLWMKKIVKIEV